MPGLRVLEMLTVTKEQARAALARVHGLGIQQKGKAGTLAVMERHMCIQSDPIDIAGRNHDLTLQSRVSDYRQKYLDDLLYKDRKLFEYTCKMLSIMPIETYPVFHWRRQFHVAQDAAFMKEHRRTVREIMKAAEEEPVASRDFESARKEHWWGMTKVTRIALERLWMEGRLAIHHREGGVKFYALAEDIVPGKFLEAEPPSEEEALLAKILFIAKASRLVSPSRAPEQWYFAGKTSATVKSNLDRLVKSGEVFRLEAGDCKGPFYALNEDSDSWKDPPESEPVARFMAPLDPLLWNRKLFAEIYGHEYAWEIYKQPHQRKYGYYCLPVLFTGSYVGLVEPFLRKKDRVLEIRSFHVLDKKAGTGGFREAVETELERFGRNLGAEKIEAGKRCPGFIKLAAKQYRAI